MMESKDEEHGESVLPNISSKRALQVEQNSKANVPEPTKGANPRKTRRSISDHRLVLVRPKSRGTNDDLETTLSPILSSPLIYLTLTPTQGAYFQATHTFASAEYRRSIPVRPYKTTHNPSRNARDPRSCRKHQSITTPNPFSTPC